jgi:hypothetical protein
MAPSSTEVFVVTVMTVIGMLAPLAVLAGLVVRRRLRRQTGVPTPAGSTAGTDNPVGRYVLLGVAVVSAAFAVRAQFVNAHGPTESPSLFTLHGQAAPVYWIAFMLGVGLLTVLSGLTLRRRHSLREVIGPAALVAALLPLGVLAVLMVKIRRHSSELVTAQLPTLPPARGLSKAALGAYEGIGWWLALTAVLTLVLVVVLVLAHRWELVVATAATLVLLAIGVATASGTTAGFWGLRQGVVTGSSYGPLELGDVRALWFYLGALVLAVLLVAIPFLPPWLRGLATVIAVASPLWLFLALLQVQSAADDRLPELLAADGYTVATRPGGLEGLTLVAALLVAPIVAIRSLRAGRRLRKAGHADQPHQGVPATVGTR